MPCTKGNAAHALDTFSSNRAAAAQVGMLLLAGSCGGAMLLPMLATLPCHIAWHASHTLSLSPDCCANLCPSCGLFPCSDCVLARTH